MESLSYPTILAFALLMFISNITGQEQSAPPPLPPAAPTLVPHPAYQPPEASTTYIPHATYPYADAFGGGAPYNFLYPVQNYPVGSSNYMSSVLPAAQGALAIALRLFAKVGLFVMGGMALLLVGGIFTTAVCSLTPLCTITFAGLGGFDRESVRSLMTPDRISTAAAMVQDAIGTYQRLQRNN